MPEAIVPIQVADAGARRRMALVAAALVVVVGVCGLGDPNVRRHPALVLANAGLMMALLVVAALCHGGRLSRRQIDRAAALLVASMTGLTLAVEWLHPDRLYVVEVVVQCVMSALLFFSLPWLIVYLVSAAAGALAVTVPHGRPLDGALIAVCAMLGLVVHVVQRERLRALAAEVLRAEARAELEAHAKAEVESEREQIAAALAESQQQLLHAQKMEAIGTLAGGVAHDMNNALSAIIGLAQVIVEEAPTGRLREDAENIVLAAERAAGLTRNLLGFGRRGQFHRTGVRPESVITEVVTLLARTLPKGIRVETRFGAALQPISADASLLGHALMNLCINAADAMAGDGTLTIEAKVELLRSERAAALGVARGTYVALVVRDTGPGMSDEVRARVFEPFFTTKGQGRGTGLGLAMVYSTVQRHDGAVEVASRPGHGATFTMWVPVAAAAAVTAPRSPTAQVPALRPGGRLLVIDDDGLVRTAVVRTLERAGFQVVCEVDGQAGLARLEAERGGFDVVLLDMAMPVMAGPETFRRARALFPTLRVLLMSGYTSPESARALLDAGALGLLAKPFTPAALLEAVEVCLRGRRLSSVDLRVRAGA